MNQVFSAISLKAFTQTIYRPVKVLLMQINAAKGISACKLCFPLRVTTQKCNFKVTLWKDAESVNVFSSQFGSEVNDA